MSTFKGSLTVWALYAYFSDSKNAAFELLVTGACSISAIGESNGKSQLACSISAIGESNGKSQLARYFQNSDALESYGG